MNLQLHELPRIPMEKIIKCLPIRTILTLAGTCQYLSYLAEMAQKLSKKRKLHYQRSLPEMRKNMVQAFNECKLSTETFRWNNEVESFHDMLESFDVEVKMASTYGVRLQDCTDFKTEQKLLENCAWVFGETEYNSARKTLLNPNLTKGIIAEIMLRSNCFGKEDEPSSLIFNIRVARENEWKDNWKELREFLFVVAREFKLVGTVASVNKFIYECSGHSNTQEFYNVFDYLDYME